MRRLLVLALATAAATAVTAGIGVPPASAHICPIPAEIAVGTPATINVGGTGEDATVTDVTISTPAGLRLDRVDAHPGWTSARAGSTVRFRGGTIAAFTCEYFSLGVTAAARGAFGISVVQRTASGHVVARSAPDPNSTSDRVLDQFVYAGMRAPKQSSGSGGLSFPLIAGIVLVVGGIVALVVLRLRARRKGDDLGDDGRGTDGGGTEPAPDLDPELRARLDRFKKQTPDPPPPA